MIKKFISHAGIKGQRWGVRRYQNEDGTLTPEGKKRYGSNPGDLEKDYHTADAKGVKAIGDGAKKLADTGANVAGNIGKNKSISVNDKDYSKISDDEIRRRINRMTMERTYGELTGDTKRVRSGADWTREVLQTTGAIAGIAATVAGTVVAINQIKLGSNGKKKTTP